MEILSAAKRRWVLIVAVLALCVWALFSLAYAQSGASLFNLNSPASFPVDI